MTPRTADCGKHTADGSRAGLGVAANAHLHKPPETRRLIVDVPVRVFHALFGLSFVLAYLTSDTERLRLVHVASGYTFAGLALFRLVYGIWGPRASKLSSVWRKVWPVPKGLFSALVSDLSAPRRLVQWVLNASVVAMLALTPLLVLTGVLNDQGWAEAMGIEGVDAWHARIAKCLLFAVCIHLALVAVLSLLLGPNFARRMLDGTAPGPGSSTIHKPRLWLGAVLGLAAIGFFCCYVAFGGNKGEDRSSFNQPGQRPPDVLFGGILAPGELAMIYRAQASGPSEGCNRCTSLKACLMHAA
ncbi:MAG: cytochrome b/b6 domain-containing protein [Casimicrobiaceae bacterium]